MSAKRTITAADILDLDAYEAVRAAERHRINALKKDRRVAIGPDATAYFECFDTMWYQIQEMLRIEKGGEAQLKDELAAYQPLIPNGHELVATVMFEIDDAERRDRVLSTLGGVEHKIYVDVGGEVIHAVPEEDVERTTEAGKASSVLFVHFPFTAEQIAAFRDPATRVMVGIDHRSYGHAATLSAAAREALAADFDA